MKYCTDADESLVFRRDVADVAGLTTYTFGVEGEDRHVMLFKKDYPLDERELQAYRNGKEWSLQAADKEAAIVREHWARCIYHMCIV